MKALIGLLIFTSVQVWSKQRSPLFSEPDTLHPQLVLLTQDASGDLNYGPLKLGKLAIKPIELVNTGNRVLTLYSLSVTSPDEIVLATDCQYQLLKPNDRCKVWVEYTPQQSGPNFNQIIFSYRDHSETIEVGTNLSAIVK